MIKPFVWIGWQWQRFIICESTPREFVIACRYIKNTTKCHYHVVQLTWYCIQYLLRQNIYQNLYSQETAHGSPVRLSYGVSVVRTWEKKKSRFNDTALQHHCKGLSALIVKVNTYSVPNLRNFRRKFWCVTMENVSNLHIIFGCAIIIGFSRSLLGGWFR